ncbi:MAG: HAD-IIB family hydrolase [Oscillospiraceae bacterium]|nr:HAD-IIB family hydrolase [Oscillospiraceae bacterium]
MKKILFACDLDNTLIHSHRHKLKNDICIEIFNEKQQSFITPRTDYFLKELYKSNNITLLPVTTRSIEQYSRINWHKDYTPEYSLVTNGSITLKNNIPVYLENTEGYYSEVESLYKKIIDTSDFLKVKIVDGMYLFAYCEENSDVRYYAEKYSELTNLTTQYSGRKIYFFPPFANKGLAVKKFAEKYRYNYIISAGDSIIDYPMLENADMAIVPDSETASVLKNPNIKICSNTVFSEFILETILNHRF